MVVAKKGLEAFAGDLEMFLHGLCHKEERRRQFLLRFFGAVAMGRMGRVT